MIENCPQIPVIFQRVKESFVKKDILLDEEKDLLLRKLWEILDAVSPVGSTKEVSGKVPCERLVDLGLVSERVAGEIKKRIVRKKQKDQPDEPQNNISFKRIAPNEFRIFKTYISEEQRDPDIERQEEPPRVGMEEQRESVRIDTVIAEEMKLVRGEGGLRLSVWQREDNVHLHVVVGNKEQRWVQANPSGERPLREVIQARDVEDARNLNRTLALVVEGLCLGCLGDRLF